MNIECNSVTWNIVLDVCQECKDEDKEMVSRELSAFVVKYVYQNPKYGFLESVPLDKDEMDRLKVICKEKLLHDQGPLMEMMRMQVMYSTTLHSASDIVAEHNRSLESRLSKLLKDIVEAKPKGKQTFEALYQQIVTSIILRSGLGSPTHNQNIRETRAAFGSVYQVQDLNDNFVHLPPIDKRTTLRQWARIVTGIRIYNWDSKRGGIEIPDLPTLLNKAVEKAILEIEAIQACLREKIATVTAITEASIYTNIGTEIDEKEVKQFRFGLATLRQFEIFQKLILTEIEKCQSRISSLDQDLLLNLTELQKLMANHFEVPCNDIFPQFQRVGKTWQGFQEEMVILSQLTSLFHKLKNHTKCVKRLALKSTIEKLHLTLFPSDEERNEDHCKGSISSEGFECVVISPGDVDGFENLTRQLNGFCPVAFVTGKGLLIRGNERIGLLHYMGKFYCCSTLERMEQFGKNPELFLIEISKLAKYFPCLDQLCSISSDRQTEQPQSKINKGQQTLVHPVQSHKDPNYTWNEWDMRKEALQLVSLSNKNTVSAQTFESHGKADKATNKKAEVTVALKSRDPSQETILPLNKLLDEM